MGDSIMSSSLPVTAPLVRTKEVTERATLNGSNARNYSIRVSMEELVYKQDWSAGRPVLRILLNRLIVPSILSRTSYPISQVPSTKVLSYPYTSLGISVATLLNTTLLQRLRHIVAVYP